MSTILAIETSCDETAAAIVSNDKRILSQCILSQLEEHKDYGGVVPEIAARAHMEHLDRLVKQALEEANITFDEIDAIAATSGPGLIGGVIVGMMMGKALASAAKKPFIAVNHLEGHALTVRLTEDVAFPYLLILVSGGHCQCIAVEDVGRYTLLGQTLDDALGEAFDKVAKMLDLGYPGGPIVEKRAKTGNPTRFDFPKPLWGRAGCDFSFSGLKTAVRKTIEGFTAPLTQTDIDDICASFQHTVGEILINRLSNAIQTFQQNHPEGKTLVLSGGVAANQYLRTILTEKVSEMGMEFMAPPMALCTDNAAMIGWAALERFERGWQDTLDIAPKARWPIDTLEPCET